MLSLKFILELHLIFSIGWYSFDLNCWKNCFSGEKHWLNSLSSEKCRLNCRGGEKYCTNGGMSSSK